MAPARTPVLTIDEGESAIPVWEGRELATVPMAVHLKQLGEAVDSYETYRAQPLGCCEGDALSDADTHSHDEPPAGAGLPFPVFSQIEGDACADSTLLMTEYLHACRGVVGEWVSGLLVMVPQLSATEEVIRTIAERDERLARSRISDQYFRHTIDKAIAAEIYTSKEVSDDDTDIVRTLSRFDSLTHLLTLYDVKRRLAQRDFEECDAHTVRSCHLGQQRVAVVRHMQEVVKDVVATGEELLLRLQARRELIGRHEKIENCKAFVAEGTLCHRDYFTSRKALRELSEAASISDGKLFDLRKAVSETAISWAGVAATVAEEHPVPPTLIEDAKMAGRLRYSMKEKAVEDWVESQVKKTQLTAKHHFLVGD